MKEIKTQTLVVNSNSLRGFDEHWKGKQAIAFQDTSESNTGIACPDCGKELKANYTLALLTNPVKYNAWCVNEKCNWKGYI